MRKSYPCVSVGWRAMATIKRENTAEAVLQPISRVYPTKGAAQEFVEQAHKAGMADAYLQEVVRPERKELGII